MNHVYSFEIIEFRRLLAECCQNIFRDNTIAEMLFRRICDCCENFLDDNIYDPWIPCEVRLPDIGEHYVSDVVLCYCKDGVYAFSELEENIFGQKCFSCERDDEYHCNPLEVIAWMPLPKFNEENEA